MGYSISTSKDLDVWNLGIELVKNINKITKDFLEEEKFEMIPQMKGPEVSILSNIDEGASKEKR